MAPQIDVTDEDGWRDTIVAVPDRFGRIDGLAVTFATTCYAGNSTCYDIETDLLCKISSPDMHDNRWRPFLRSSDCKRVIFLSAAAVGTRFSP